MWDSHKIKFIQFIQFNPHSCKWWWIVCKHGNNLVSTPSTIFILSLWRLLGIINITNQYMSDQHWKLGSTAQPIRHSMGPFNCMHRWSRTEQSNSVNLVSHEPLSSRLLSLNSMVLMFGFSQFTTLCDYHQLSSVVTASTKLTDLFTYLIFIFFSSPYSR